jgi:hypothetical protein
MTRRRYTPGIEARLEHLDARRRAGHALDRELERREAYARSVERWVDLAFAALCLIGLVCAIVAL